MQKRTGHLITWLCILANCLNVKCKQTDADGLITSKYVYLRPHYDKVQMFGTSDTLHFYLNDSAYNDIESMNYFQQGTTEYLSFFDKRSASINIYQPDSRYIKYKLPITKFIKKPKLSNTSVYMKNFDTIVIADKYNIYVFDSSGIAKVTIPFKAKQSAVKSKLEASRPPVFIDQKMYTIVKPSGMINSVTECLDWKSLYEFDLKNKKATLHYNLPKVYQTDLRSFQYLYSSYCL